MSVLAWSDLHGRLDIFEKGLDFLTPEDTVYFLGDAADRGANGWTIIKKILNDSRFIYLKGNHEDLLIKAIGNIKPESLKESVFRWDRNMDLWFYNGGEPTYNAIVTDESLTPGQKAYIIHQLKDLPFAVGYMNEKGQQVQLSHSGYDDFYLGNEEQFIWDRNHLMFYDSWNGENNEIIVHGHTPIELMIEEQHRNAEWLTEKHMREGILGDHFAEPQPWDGHSAYWYAKNHKVNIDTGAVWNNVSVLLNLDTWEETYIQVPPIKS